MEPSKDENALVDVLDVLLRDGAVVRADVIVSVADVPLIGIKLTAAVAGMETMNEYGLFEEWDASRRKRAVSRRQYGRRRDERALEGGGAGDDRPRIAAAGSTETDGASSEPDDETGEDRTGSGSGPAGNRDRDPDRARDRNRDGGANSDRENRE